VSKKITCLMPTYKRPPKSLHLINEAVESFHRQDYPNKELIIVNDHPSHTLIYNHKDVLVVNLPRRCKTLGEKINFTASLAQGDILCRWDDDDICLPWRLSYSEQQLGEGYWKPKSFWAVDDKLDRYRLEYGAFAHCMFTREAWVLAKGYAFKDIGEDQQFERHMKTVSKVAISSMPLDKVFYLYRWNTGGDHISGFGFKKDGYALLGGRNVSAGEFQIRPNWRKDYVKIIADRIPLEKERQRAKR
jgi:glycosyltransferase involved in cell wall biosynthesis